MLSSQFYPYPERAQTVDAVYSEQEVPLYEGNPLLEALPPILSSDDLFGRLARYPLIGPKDRLKRPEIRYHLALQVRHLLQPLTKHLDLAQRISSILRDGYVDRNPARPGYFVQAAKLASQAAAAIHYYSGDDEAAAGFAVYGVSGMGKTIAIKAILRLYPQLIQHTSYRGNPLIVPQVVWLRLECPPDGSLKALCIQFFQKMSELTGNDYRKRYAAARRSVDEMLIDMALVAATHCLGLLIVDEIQNLRQATGFASKHVLNFFRYLTTMGIPVIPIGTYSAEHILSGTFQNGRRNSALGDFEWDRMLWGDDEFDLLLETVWNYQYVSNVAVLTKELRWAYYDESQGISALVVIVHILAQIRSIATGEETITVEIIRSVAFDSLRLVAPLVDALRNGERDKLIECDDLVSKLKLEHLSVDARLGTSRAPRLFSDQKDNRSVPSACNSAEPLGNREPAGAHNDVSASVGTIPPQRIKPRRTPRKSADHKGGTPHHTPNQNGPSSYDTLRQQGAIKDIARDIFDEQA